MGSSFKMYTNHDCWFVSARSVKVFAVQDVFVSFPGVCESEEVRPKPDLTYQLPICQLYLLTSVMPLDLFWDLSILNRPTLVY